MQDAVFYSKFFLYIKQCSRNQRSSICCCWVINSCLSLCDSVDCKLLDSSVHRISQARILQWVAMPSSRRTSQSRDWICISYITGIFFTAEPPGGETMPGQKKKKDAVIPHQEHRTDRASHCITLFSFLTLAASGHLGGGRGVFTTSQYSKDQQNVENKKGLWVLRTHMFSKKYYGSTFLHFRKALFYL